MPGSENTALLSDTAKVAPIVIVSIVIFAPLLEEIVFRRVLFGGIYTKSNFWVAAILSGIIFAVVHGELEHTLIYMAPGMVFAFLYYHTKSIWTPMIAHFLMNGFVMIIQLNAEKLEQTIQHEESLHLLSSINKDFPRIRWEVFFISAKCRK